MEDLFNLPASRTTKGVDKSVVNKSTNKKSAPIIVKGGGLIEKISSINALVESKLGKYKNYIKTIRKVGYKFEYKEK